MGKADHRQKSVVRIVSDAVVGESVTNTLAGTADNVLEMKDKAGKALDNMSGAVAGLDNKLSGVSNFLHGASNGGITDMLGDFSVTSAAATCRD